MKLLGVGIKNYRSIGEDYVFLDFSRKINLLIGANNCGKSNALKALELFAKKKINWNDQLPKISEIDRHQRNSKLDVAFKVKFEHDFTDAPQLRHFNPVIIEWVRIDQDGNVAHSNLLNSVDWQGFNPMMQAFTHQYYQYKPSDAQLQNTSREVATRIFKEFLGVFPEVVIVPQFRQIVEGANYSLAGQGIVKLLASWQNPEIGSDKNHEKFLKIEDLLRRLLEMPKVRLEVSHKQDHIIVANDGLRLPLEHYGTGIHELIIIAIAVLSNDKAIFCIEEPEIHLHPLLQKRLVDFLRNETPNQFVITTHSPALIAPQDDTAVIHLWLENGVTKSRQVETTAETLKVLHDLGVQASDLLQANSVIWVEGPSDRIYLNAWLRLIDPNLREDIDYSIMFYGGRLLSHLSMEREESTEDLVKLLHINQHSAILIDSDKASEADEINKTKQRIKSECQANAVHCWITAGREIENYLPVIAIAKAYGEIAGKETELKFKKFDRLEKCLVKAYDDSWKPSWSYDDAKPAMARAITKHFTNDNLETDLRSELEKLVAVIRHKITA